MKPRFTVRREDEDVQVESLQEFETLVRSGVIREDDLVHDALTGEWGPARAHPVYQLVMDPLTGEPSDSGESDVPTSDDEDMGFSMELVEEERRTPEEDTQAFIEQMKREREEDPHRVELGEGVEVFDGRSAPSLSHRSERDDTERPHEDAGKEASPGPSGPHASEPDPRVPAASVDAGVPDLPEVAAVSEASFGPAGSVAWGSPPELRGLSGQKSFRDGGGRHRAVVILGVALLVLGVTAAVAHPAFRFQDTGPPVEEVRASRDAPPTDAELRASSRTAFLTRVDSLRAAFSVDRLPSGWLEGRYLAEASAFPEVGRFWTDYLRYVEQVREEEEALYRDAYLAVLDESGMRGPVRSLRMAAAAGDFEARAHERAARYAGVRELVVAADSLHEILVELEGEITWEPARSERLSADPVTEAAGRDADTQARMEAALDRVLAALYEVTGGGRDIHDQRPDWLARALAEGQIP